MFSCHCPWKYQRLCGITELIRGAEGEEGRALDFLNSSETGKVSALSVSTWAAAARGAQSKQGELGHGKCPAGKGLCTTTQEARTLGGAIHAGVEKSSTKCRRGCCYTEEEAAPEHMCPAGASSRKLFQSFCGTGTNLGFLNRCCRINGDVLSIVQDLVAWQGVTKSGVCALPSWEYRDRDTTLAGAFVWLKRATVYIN